MRVDYVITGLGAGGAEIALHKLLAHAATVPHPRHFRIAAYAVQQGFLHDRLWPREFSPGAWHRALQDFGLREPV
jgi:hypothetical protein